jgi:SAM-dependent methyltransferase
MLLGWCLLGEPLTVTCTIGTVLVATGVCQPTTSSSLTGNVHDRLTSQSRAPAHLRPTHRGSSTLIVENLSPGDTVLDIGCGLGTLGEAIASHSNCPPDVTVRGLEKKRRGGEPIEVMEYAGGRLPFSDREDDVVILADVLHHEREEDFLLSEAARIARRILVVKDHKTEGLLGFWRVCFLDWAANNPYDVKCLYSYHTKEEGDSPSPDTDSFHSSRRIRSTSIRHSSIRVSERGSTISRFSRKCEANPRAEGGSCTRRYFASLGDVEVRLTPRAFVCRQEKFRRGGVRCEEASFRHASAVVAGGCPNQGEGVARSIVDQGRDPALGRAFGGQGPHPR